MDRALNAAQNQADHMTDEYISVEHLMLGLMETADSNLKTIFQRHNLTKEEVPGGAQDRARQHARDLRHPGGHL